MRYTNFFYHLVIVGGGEKWMDIMHSISLCGAKINKGRSTTCAVAFVIKCVATLIATTFDPWGYDLKGFGRTRGT